MKLKVVLLELLKIILSNARQSTELQQDAKIKEIK